MSIEDTDRAYQLLYEKVKYYPSEKILAELSIIIDRVEFNPELKEFFNQSTALDKTMETLSALFVNEVSEDVYQGVVSIAKESLLSILFEKESNFLSYCYQKLNQMKEVTVITAVKLEENTRVLIANRLASVEVNKNTKFVFETQSRLIGGFILKKENDVFDYSLRANVFNNIHIYFQNKVRQMT